MPQGIGARPDLADVRRFEAAGFRAWPASETRYDGTWAIRLTPGHKAKRLNSVNPLDPGDLGDLDGRVARAAGLFAEHGRVLTFRMSPLSGAKLSSYLDGKRWTSFDPSVVMGVDLAGVALDDAVDQIPLKDVCRFVDIAGSTHGGDDVGGLAEIIAAIVPEAGLFVRERQGTVLSTLICVHDGPLSGLFEVATAARERGSGHARQAILSALKWARLRGARTAWLQVGADNAPALHLYRSLGFSELYSYHYRRPPEEQVPR